MSTLPLLPKGVSIQQRSKNGNVRAVIRLRSGERRSQTFRELAHAMAWVLAAHEADQSGQRLPEASAFGAVGGKRPTHAPPPDVGPLRAERDRVPTLEEAVARFAAFDESQFMVKEVSGAWILANRGYLKNHILPFFSERPCAQSVDLLTTEDVGAFAKHLLKAPNGRGGTLTGRHAGQIMGSLRRLVKFCISSQWMSHDPTSIVVTHRASRRKESERMRIDLSMLFLILSSLPEIHWMAVLLQRLTGLRPLEAFGLRLKNIDLERRLMWICEQAGHPQLSNPGDTETVVANRKSAKGPAAEVTQRWVPIPPILVPFIEAWILVFHKDPITAAVDEERFLCDTGRRSYRWIWMTLNQAWNQAVEAQGLTDKTEGGISVASLRSLRYSLGCDALADRRIPPRFVSELLGHEYRGKVSRTSLDYYATRTKLTADELADVAKVGKRVERSVLRNSPRGNIVPILTERLLNPEPAEAAEGMTPQAAALRLGIARSTAYLWIRNGTFEGVTLGAPRGTGRLFSIPVSEVERLARQLEGLTPLSRLAEMTGMAKCSLWSMVASGELDAKLIGKAYFVPTERAEWIVADVQRRRQLRSDYLTVADAARYLGISAKSVEALTSSGVIDEHNERTLYGERLVTLPSVKAYKAACVAARERRVGAPKKRAEVDTAAQAGIGTIGDPGDEGRDVGVTRLAVPTARPDDGNGGSTAVTG